MKQTKQKSRRKPDVLTDAQRQLIVDNMQFAINMGLKYSGLGRYHGVTVTEMQQSALFALCIAAQKYKPTRNADFKTYAYRWCQKYILLEINRRELTLMDDNTDVIDNDDDNDDDVTLHVSNMLDILNAKERQVVCLVFGIPQSDIVQDCDPKGFREIASILQIKSARVHDIYECAMAKMELNIMRNA